MISDPLPFATGMQPGRAAFLAGSLALFLLTSSPAAYAKKPTPSPTTTPTTTQAQAATPDLAITFTGPTEGRAGTSAVWTLTVRNHGTAASGPFSAMTRLPKGMFVETASAEEGWACVLGDTFTEEEGLQAIPDISCSLFDGLPAGATAPGLTITLRYGRELVGPQQVAAEVTQAQGEPDDALSDNRHTQTTTLLAAAAETPSPTPTPSPNITNQVPGPELSEPAFTVPPTPAPPATGPNNVPAQLPYTGAGTTAGITLSTFLILLGAALIRLGRQRYVARHG